MKSFDTLRKLIPKQRSESEQQAIDSAIDLAENLFNNIATIAVANIRQADALERIAAILQERLVNEQSNRS